MSAVANTLRRYGLKPEDIARHTSIPIERASSLMSGAQATLTELRMLAERLKIPLSSFLGDAGLSEATRIQFRATAQAGAPDSTIERTKRFVEAALKVLPSRTTVPSWLSTLRPAEESYAEAKRLASAFRLLFYADRPDDPALDLAQVLSAQGDVVVGRLRQSQYEGASLISGGYPFILVSTRFLPRMLFTLAHELGHVIAHHNANAAPIFERATSIGYGRRRSKREHFVDAFASLVLLPAGGVATALAKVREIFKITADAIGDVEILLIARFFGVSFEVAARRCEDLELLPQGGARSLLEQVSKDYKNPERRADVIGLPARANVVLPPVSQNLMRAIVKKVADGEISVGWATTNFAISVDHINAAHAEFDREIRH